MIPLFFTRIKTHDGISLHGVVVHPSKKSGMALVWVHGLGSSFSLGYNRIAEMTRRVSASGMAFFAFDTRGHHLVAYGEEKGPLLGAGFEHFEDCIRDIRAVIGHAKKLGVSRIILAGHSTGANKALYYLYKTRDPAVRGLILAGAVSDIAAGRKKFGPAGLARGVALAQKIVRKNSKELMPQKYGIFTAQRFLSAFRQGSTEDVFPYLNPKAGWKELKSIRVPLAVIFGSRDAYLTRPASQLLNIFRTHALSTKSFTGAIITGADHGFKGKEKELTRTIISWIRRAVV